MKPIAEQLKQEEDLIKQFLNIILSNESKIDAFLLMKKERN
jgi:hypothetical protein